MAQVGDGGSPFRAYVEANAPLEPHRAALLAAELAAQVAALHEISRVHGRLGPDAVSVEYEPRPRLVLVGPEASGRPHSDRDAASDVRAIGCMLAELLGARPAAHGTLSMRPETVPAALRGLLERTVTGTGGVPSAAELARQLHAAGRDVLPGRPPAPTAGAVGVPAFVPGLGVPPQQAALPAPTERTALVRPQAPTAPVPLAEPRPLAAPAEPPRRRHPGVVFGGAAVAVIMAGVGIALAVAGTDAGSARQAGALPASSSAAPTSSTVLGTPGQAPAPPAKAQAPATTAPAPADPPDAPAGQVPAGQAAAEPAPPAAPAAPPRPAPPPPATQGSAAACSPGCAARVTFVAQGEHLYVCDKASDGHSAVATYQRSDVPGQHTAWDHDGTGTCADHNMSMPEGATITFRACTGEYAARKILRCGAPVSIRS